MKAVIDRLTSALFEKAEIHKIAGETAREEFKQAVSAALTSELYPRKWLTRNAVLPDLENHTQPLTASIAEHLSGFSINGSAMSADNKARLPERIRDGVNSYLLNRPEKAAHAAVSSSPAAYGERKEAEIFESFEKKPAAKKPEKMTDRLNSERAKQTHQQGGGYGSFF